MKKYYNEPMIKFLLMSDNEFIRTSNEQIFEEDEHDIYLEDIW